MGDLIIVAVCYGLFWAFMHTLGWWLEVRHVARAVIVCLVAVPAILAYHRWQQALPGLIGLGRKRA